MSLFQIIFVTLRALIFTIIGVAILVLAFIELFSGGITTFILYIALHAIYGHTVLAKQAEVMAQVVASKDQD